jgi:antitoxin FitA
MAHLIVRNLDAEVKRKLQRRALRHGRSLEEEVLDILRSATKGEDRDPRHKVGLGTAIASRFKGIGLDEPIPELRGFVIKPAKLD